MLTIKGSSLEDLIDKVMYQRAQSGIDTSTLIEDIEDYICGLSKYMCRRKRGLFRPEGATVSSRPITELINRIGGWLARIYGAKERLFVSQAEASRRAEICRGCRQNVRWHVDCGPCNSKIERALFCVRGNRTTESDIKLERKGCRALGICHRTAVHLDLKQMEIIPDTKDAPPDCWVKKL